VRVCVAVQEPPPTFVCESCGFKITLLRPGAACVASGPCSGLTCRVGWRRRGVAEQAVPDQHARHHGEPSSHARQLLPPLAAALPGPVGERTFGVPCRWSLSHTRTGGSSHQVLEALGLAREGFVQGWHGLGKVPHQARSI
jgi:hypothetical protein